MDFERERCFPAVPRLKTSFHWSSFSSLLCPSFPVLVCYCCITKCHKLNGLKQHLLTISQHALTISVHQKCKHGLAGCLCEAAVKVLVRPESSSGERGQAYSDCWQNSFTCSYRSVSPDFSPTVGWRPPSAPRGPSQLFATWVSEHGLCHLCFPVFKMGTAMPALSDLVAVLGNAQGRYQM